MKHLLIGILSSAIVLLACGCNGKERVSYIYYNTYSYLNQLPDDVIIKTYFHDYNLKNGEKFVVTYRDTISPGQAYRDSVVTNRPYPEHMLKRSDSSCIVFADGRLLKFINKEPNDQPHSIYNIGSYVMSIDKPRSTRYDYYIDQQLYDLAK